MLRTILICRHFLCQLPCTHSPGPRLPVERELCSSLFVFILCVCVCVLACASVPKCGVSPGESRLSFTQHPVNMKPSLSLSRV
jgi:hypothetical protein